MKSLIKFLFAMLVTITLAHAAAFEKNANFRTTHINISAQKPLTAGSNELVLLIKKENTLISDAKVSVKAFMPAMPGMPAMESKADAVNKGNGEYIVKLNLVMNGTWQLHVFITPKKGKKLRVKTTLNF
ncbi:FixH family protein [Sulfurimonas sp. C5]|uniref:FixH family protein n=1 Tax=Sulfurimonas sp. C5 TaxID=3036947 RepID=UPI002454C1B7|nr:FixH family protein [Sulfurimonas sp. C5]MDH4944299.1 FixH family protein [Sulfurimonas sp. C5]